MGRVKPKSVEAFQKMKINPAADIFPMMVKDELADLAADIKANGLKFPITTDADGQLLDGRNRLKACEIAGVEPRFEKLNGQDPLAFIVSANLVRRNLSKGQQAMAYAMVYSEPAQVGRGKKGSGIEPFAKSRLSEARAILHHSADLGRAVMNGLPFDDALAQMKTERAMAAAKQEMADCLKANRQRIHFVDHKLNLARMRQEEQAREQEIKLRVQLGRQLIEIGYKVLASKLHPDHGGSQEGMTRLNKVRDFCKKAVMNVSVQ
jgi:hypothetical protein